MMKHDMCNRNKEVRINNTPIDVSRDVHISFKGMDGKEYPTSRAVCDADRAYMEQMFPFKGQRKERLRVNSSIAEAMRELGVNLAKHPEYVRLLAQTDRMLGEAKKDIKGHLPLKRTDCYHIFH